MRRLLAATSLTVFGLAAVTSPLWAEMNAIGDLRISTPMLRETPPNAPVAGGYLVIENGGEADDILVAAAVPAALAGMVQLHAMTMDAGVMIMEEVEGGIPIPAGETVTLEPGGLHLMLSALAAPLAAGDSHPVTLTFAEAGEVTIDMPVRSLGEIRAAFADAPSTDHGAHGAHGN